MQAQRDPVIVHIGDEWLLGKLLGRQVVALAFVPDTDAAMVQFDSETAVYFRVVDNRLQIEVEGPGSA